MDTLQINHALSAFRPTFRGTFARNHLPLVYTLNPPFGMVVNTDPAHLEGSHWVAWFGGGNGTVEYFDSAGLPPPTSVFMSDQTTVIYNSRRLQSACTSLCGEWCIYFLSRRMCGIPFEDLMTPFDERDWLKNDAMIYALIHDEFDILPKRRSISVVSPACVQLSKALGKSL